MKYTFLVESFTTDFANPRFEAGVDADVRVQSRTAIETLSTRRASVRLFLRVDDLVPTQRARLSKACFTNVRQSVSSLSSCHEPG